MHANSYKIRFEWSVPSYSPVNRIVDMNFATFRLEGMTNMQPTSSEIIIITVVSLKKYEYWLEYYKLLCDEVKRDELMWIGVRWFEVTWGLVTWGEVRLILN